jgi:PPM family protein phosphatase
MPALMMRPAVASEVGPRQNNEDAAFASPRLAAVADGVGGAIAGEVASGLAINKIVGLDKRRLEHPLPQELNATVADANAVIEFVISYDPQLSGMGTTLTAVALSNEGEYMVANVGDSRTYLHRDGQLRRLTRDQSLVQMLIDSGALTEEEARRHPERSVVLEALDGVERPLPPIRQLQARRGDRLLLCSDGVTDYVTDRELERALTKQDAREAARDITTLALDHGARDNVTAIVADVVARTSPREGWLGYLPAGGRSL